jgi:fermentation-respiration switch protein FrsA (DUF1100 family)
LKVLLRLLFALLLVSGILYLRQPAMIFYPDGNLLFTPDEWGLAFEEVDLKTADGVRLNGWYLPAEEAQGTLLFLHGNAGNISHRGESLQIFHRLGLNVLIIDYRGYGKSTGAPSEKGMYRDARAAWDYLVKERAQQAEKIVLFGRSLGGAVAAHLAAEVKPAGVIIESSFSSARDMAKELFPVLSYLTILRYDFDAASALQKLHVPLLVMHSPEDEIIPYRLGEKLYRAANEPKFFQPMRGGHNTGFLQTQPEYEQALRRFLSQQVYNSNQ